MNIDIQITSIFFFVFYLISYLAAQMIKRSNDSIVETTCINTWLTINSICGMIISILIRCIERDGDVVRTTYMIIHRLATIFLILWCVHGKVRWFSGIAKGSDTIILRHLIDQRFIKRLITIFISVVV